MYLIFEEMSLANNEMHVTNDDCFYYYGHS